MKRRDLVRNLTAGGCELLREGGNHSWWRKTVVRQFLDITKSATS